MSTGWPAFMPGVCAMGGSMLPVRAATIPSVIYPVTTPIEPIFNAIATAV
ncbi:MAG: hypothetical protein ACE5LB_01365 [Acidiferrobacterales bacterium]